MKTRAFKREQYTPLTRIENPLFSVAGSTVDNRVVTDRRRRRLTEQRLQNAHELRRVLTTDELPEIPGYSLTSAYRPASDVGGDFFQIIPLRDNATLVVMGDVSSKGLRAAMAVSFIVGIIRTLAETIISPAQILAGLNRFIHGRLQDGFATAIALRLDSAGNCAIAAAGHPSPFLNGRELAMPGVLPLGVDSKSSYEEISIHLREADHLALYTNGLFEARDITGEIFSFERLQALFLTLPEAVQATQAAVSFGQNDDITVITLTRLAAGERGDALFTPPILPSA